MTSEAETFMRRGLVENAGGSLVCPVCRSPKLWPFQVRLLSPDLSVVVDVANPGVVVEPVGHRAGVEVQAIMRCQDRHDSAVTILWGPEGPTARVTTEWSSPDEP